MFVIQLEQKGRRLRLSFNIREHVPPGELARLSLAVPDADCDLFVNKFSKQVEDFLADLSKSW
jgi:hypothetical protein